MATYQEKRVEYHEYSEYGSQPYRTYSFSEKTGDLCGGQSQSQLYRSDNFSYKKSGGTADSGTMTAVQKTAADQFGACRSENYGTRTETVSEDPFFQLVPSSFPPGTDQKVIDCFNKIDKDRSGLICDKELQSALSNFSQSFSLRTVRLLMYAFTGTNARTIGPREFVPLINSLQSWKAGFQRFDRNRNGSIDASELREALQCLGFSVTPVVLKLLVAKFDKNGGKSSIQYDNFIECCLTIKGLTEKFRAKENSYCGTASFTFEEFLLSVLPFIIA
ncbi:hypothetical protein Ancab_031047 [Ancistrocladus abbreviatus]